MPYLKKTTLFLPSTGLLSLVFTTFSVRDSRRESPLRRAVATGAAAAALFGSRW